MLWLWFQIAVAADPCAEPVNTNTVSAAIEQAHAAFGRADLEEFQAATAALTQSLPCVVEPVPRYLAAEVHRTYGMLAFVNQDTDQAMLAFRAARTLEPAYVFPQVIVPAGHPLLQSYEASDLGAESRTLMKPLEGMFQFDGRRGLHRPADRPTVVQWLGDEGAVKQTGYLWPDEPFWRYDEAPRLPERHSSALDKPLTQAPVRHRSRGLMAAAGAGALLAGGALTGAFLTRAEIDDPTSAEDAMLRTRADALTVTSGGIGGAALGLGVAAVVVGEW